MEPKKKICKKISYGDIDLSFYYFDIVLLKQYVAKYTSYFNLIDISYSTSSIFPLHVPISTAAFLEISKNTLSKSDVHFYIEYGPIILFFIFLLVVSQNRKTQFFFETPCSLRMPRLKEHFQAQLKPSTFK